MVPNSANMDRKKVTAGDFMMTKRAPPCKTDVDAFFNKLRALHSGSNYSAVQKTNPFNESLHEESITAPVPNSTMPLRIKTLEDEAAENTLIDYAQDLGSGCETEEESMTAQGSASASSSQEEINKTEQGEVGDTETSQAQKHSVTSDFEVQNDGNMEKAMLQTQQPREITVQTRVADPTWVSNAKTVEPEPSFSTLPPEEEIIEPELNASQTIDTKENTSPPEPTVTVPTLHTWAVKEDFIGTKRPVPDSFAVENFFARIRQQENSAGVGGEGLVGWNVDETVGNGESQGGWW